jgi:hypothetical protein
MQKTLNDNDKKFLKRAAVVSPEGSFLLVRERELELVPKKRTKCIRTLNIRILKIF